MIQKRTIFYRKPKAFPQASFLIDFDFSPKLQNFAARPLK